jgi:hypothetical protein
MMRGDDVMRLWREQGIVWAALLALSNSSLAASISLSPLPLDNDPTHALVAVDGRFEGGDEIKFRTEVGRLTKAVVVFNSDGGDLQAGIEIGKTIRLKSFATAVLNGFRCASSCAFAWLGGSPRFMDRGAQIGFHAAYTFSGGRASESGVGNALVGSYLTQIGLSETAVVYITRAAPTQLTLLTLQDAQRIGIDVLPLEQRAPPMEQRRPPAHDPPPLKWDDVRINPFETPVRHPELSERALSFVNEIHSKWSKPNAADLAWLDPLYADEVNFYGKSISRAEVLAEKRLFTERWPERNYKIQANSMTAVCDESRPGITQSAECIVTGTVEWATRSLARNAADGGLSGFTYVLQPSGGTFIIKGESGSVIQPPPSTQKRDAQVHIQVQVTTSGARCFTRATAAGRTRTFSRTMVNASLA